MKAIILIAPPGAGKGTQADMLEEKFGYYHLETSKIIEKNFKNADPNDAIINEEKKRWLSGELMKPSTFVPWMIEDIKNLSTKGQGLILSGSPRTLAETPTVMTALEENYGKENITVLNIELNEEESVKRNGGRRICQANRHPIPNFPEFANLTVCPQDCSPLVTRALDKPEIIRERYQVYWRDTAPVLDYLREHGYQINVIDGEQSIEKVFADICKFLITN